MTVLLVGVGADTSNSSRPPPIYDDHRFEFIPIPDNHESTESMRYGNWALRYQNGVLAEYFESIERKGTRLREFADVPLHHDPNFEALTFGDPGKTRSKLTELCEGDLLAFYTGLAREDKKTPVHRYIIGYFTVESVVNFAGLSGKARREAIEANTDNAHIKRYQTDENERHLSDLVIARGKEPAVLLDRAVQVSERRANGHYYFTEEWKSFLSPRSAYLGGFKNPIFCDVSPSVFIDRIEEETTRLR